MGSSRVPNQAGGLLKGYMGFPEEERQPTKRLTAPWAGESRLTNSVSYPQGALPIRCGSEGSCQTQSVQTVDQPLGRVEIVPAWAIAIIAGIGVMIVMISLSKREQRDEPIIAAGIRLTVWLIAP